MELPTGTWTVVQFVQDKTVEAVPTNWIDGDKCHWPPLRKTKLSKAIKKLQSPEPTWMTFTVKRFRNGMFNDYAKARKKAKEAEETSDLQSEVDNSGGAKKRKIYRPSWDSSSEDLSSEETMLPTPPSLGRKPNIVTATTEESSSFTNKTRPYEKRQAEEEPEVFGTIENQGTSQLAKIEQYCKTVLEQQHLLRSLLTDVLGKVNRLEERYNAECPHSAPERGSRSIYSQNIVFPINCEEELDKLEKYLQDDNNFKDAVRELAMVGGVNNYNFVKRVMASLITNRLGTQYSWLGRKGKKIFHTLKVAKIIIDAAAEACVGKSKKETEISIQSWLRRATERTKHVVKDL